MKTSDIPVPQAGFLVTHFLTVKDQEKVIYAVPQQQNLNAVPWDPRTYNTNYAGPPAAPPQPAANILNQAKDYTVYIVGVMGLALIGMGFALTRS